MRPFERHGLEHLGTLALLAATAWLLVSVTLRRRAGVEHAHAAFRLPLAALLVMGLGFALWHALPLRGLDWLDFRPRPGANLRVFWITNAYALLAGIIDVAAGKNYLYLRAKPSKPSILDVMGPRSVRKVGTGCPDHAALR